MDGWQWHFAGDVRACRSSLIARGLISEGVAGVAGPGFETLTRQGICSAIHLGTNIGTTCAACLPSLPKVP